MSQGVNILVYLIAELDRISTQWLIAPIVSILYMTEPCTVAGKQFHKNAMWIYILAATVLIFPIGFFVWRATRKRLPRALSNGLQHIDHIANAIIGGHEVTDAELADCAAEFDKLYRYLTQKNSTSDNTKFSRTDAAFFYVYAIKLAAIQHPNHNAWPLMPEIRKSVLNTLLPEIGLSSDRPREQGLERLQKDWIRLALITPALLDSDVRLALQLYQDLPSAFARIAMPWIRETSVGYKDYNDVQSSERLLQLIGVEEVATLSTRQDISSPEQRWALSMAVHPSYAADPRSSLDDPLPAAVCRVWLKLWWDVTDADSALGMLDWLYTEGHRVRLVEELDMVRAESLGDRSIEADIANPLDASKLAFLKGNEVALRRHEIAAWDLCRLVGLARTCHKAGFIDEPTAWEFIFSAAQELRDTYKSWNEMGDDYILGNCYFDARHRPEPIHRASVRWLQESPRSPWNTIAW